MALIIVNSQDESLCWNASSQTWEKDDYDTFNDQHETSLPENGRWEVVSWRKRN